MADDIDRACEREEQERARAILAAGALRSLPYVGVCYNCEAIVPQGYRFCDGDCRDDYQRRENQRVRNG